MPPFRGPRVLALNVAREMTLTGQQLSALRAEALVEVTQTTEPGDALASAHTLADQVVAKAPLSVQTCMQAVHPIVGAHDALGWETTEAATARLMGTADLREGVDSFLEKRAPIWTGR